ncbi:MAG: cyclic nucleotide-binding protein [Proteobacteria bacterium]|nr:MAG: cyclic nucleotide-binding protein [Pseudomonadota bacterium]
MSILEQKSFIKSIYPFNHLDEGQLDEFAKNMDIVYFKEDQIIQKKGQEPEFLYFILKGLVEEANENELSFVYSKGEIFSHISLIENYSKYTFRAKQECICYTLPKKIFLNILHVNEKLESYFFQSIAEKLNNSSIQEKNKTLADMMLSKVKDAKIHKVVITDSNISIFEAAKIIKDEKIPTLLIRDEDGKLHIVTDSDFRQKVILNRMDFDEKIITIASEGLVYIYEDNFLFDAQFKMSKYGLKRLVVKDKNEKITGIIDQISLTSFFSTNTFTISNQIQNAKSVDDLKEVSKEFLQIIKSLYVKGVKIEFITKLINQLNQKMLDKLYRLTAPDELFENSCLIVMGSEGRAEQVVKTDQDNGIILDDNFEMDEKKLRDFANQFSQTLQDFGFPKCDGNIMISNPFWCKKQKEYKKDLYDYINNPNPQNFINIAIFYDALHISGEKNLLKNLTAYMYDMLDNSDIFYSHFAKIITNFDVPLGFFDGFVYSSKDEHKNELNIKKGGIFIIVHGVRSLAIEHKITSTNTIKRIKKLGELGILEDDFTKDLIMAFNFLLNLKLTFQLEKISKKEPIDNYINPQHLSSMQKDLLKDAFKIVNEFKKFLSYHFRLNYV